MQPIRDFLRQIVYFHGQLCIPQISDARPEQAAPKLPGANGFKYREQFGVIVICKDEAEHKAVYERLKAQGYKCKVVRV